MIDEPKPKLAVTNEELDEEEKEFLALRRDLPGSIQGAAAVGIVTISVGKSPTKNEFFRCNPDYQPIIAMVSHEVGLEKQFFAVTAEMIEPLASIAIKTADYRLYLTVTSHGSLRIIPIMQANAETGEQNDYHRTKEIAMLKARNTWVRMFTDLENHAYRVFPAPEGRFGDPQWPPFKPAKLTRLAFKDKGRLIDSVQHPLFMK